MNDDKSEKIKLALEGLVPLAFLEIRTMPQMERQQIAANAAQTICEAADQLMYGGRRAGEVLSAIAKALAILADRPGGVSFAGLHFCTNHSTCITG